MIRYITLSITFLLVILFGSIGTYAANVETPEVQMEIIQLDEEHLDPVGQGNSSKDSDVLNEDVNSPETSETLEVPEENTIQEPNQDETTPNDSVEQNEEKPEKSNISTQDITPIEFVDGDSSEEVRSFKQKLVRLGFASWKKPSKNYGPITAGVVKTFQRTYGLKADGIAREETINKVNSLIDQGRLQDGDVGDHVAELKKNLVLLGFANWKNPSKNYGPITSRVVEDFQRHYGLIVSGVANKLTVEKINEILNPPYRSGDQGQPVVELKQKLVRLGFATWHNPSPIYGKNTANRVKDFQEAYGLTVDGIAGNQTLNKLNDLLNSGKYQNGDTGKHVVNLKQKLVKLGFAKWKSPSPNYGPITSEVVEDFQAYYGLRKSGVANQATINKLNEILDTMFKTGNSGKEVITLKRNLTKLAFGNFPKNPSRNYGPVTEGVIREFQKHYGLKVNGIADIITLNKINDILSTKYQNGNSGNHVVKMKKDLNLFGMGFPNKPSNKYGNVTERKVKEFQKLFNLPVSGIADEVTLKTIKDNIKKVFIDPGHGGSDPGASGYGLREKNLTLDIARHIQSRLQSQYLGIDVRLSRTNDQTLSLDQRSSAANSWKPDLFVSVHINAAGGQGFESFIHNGNVSNATKKYQNTIHNHIVNQMKFVDRGQKRANFHVLRETKMPAILFEFLFIDNRGDNNQLSKSSYRKRIGNATADGIAKALKLKGK